MDHERDDDGNDSEDSEDSEGRAAAARSGVTRQGQWHQRRQRNEGEDFCAGGRGRSKRDEIGGGADVPSVSATAECLAPQYWKRFPYTH